MGIVLFNGPRSGERNVSTRGSRAGMLLVRHWGKLLQCRVGVSPALRAPAGVERAQDRGKPQQAGPVTSSSLQ